MLATHDTGSSNPTDGGQSGVEEWGAVRTAEYTMILQWLYERHPRDQATQAMLLHDMTLIRTLGNQKMGDYDETGWTGFFEQKNFYKDGNSPHNQRSHGVNVAMALKEAALKWRVSGREADKQESRHNWDIVYQYHGKVAGHFAADEHLAGLMPDRGAETCQIVENMWSSSITYATFGETQDADRAEQMAFNSLPAAMTGDWWGRQYLQQENQVSSQPFKTNPFASDGPESNVFGLQTNYPCCTVNHPQGLPRFVSRAYLTKGNDTLLHAYLVPTTVNVQLSSTNNVSVTADTIYPFTNTVKYTFQAQQSFTFAVRVPQWATTAVLRSSTDVLVEAGRGVDSIQIIVPAGLSAATYTMTTVIEAKNTPGGNADSVYVRNGALIFTLPIKYTLQKLRQDDVQPKAIDNLRLPYNQTTWMLGVDTSTAQVVDLSGVLRGAALRSPVFDEDNAPIGISIETCPTAEGWDVIDNGQWVKGFPPSNASCAVGIAKQNVVLLPYGAAKLRLASLASVSTAHPGATTESKKFSNILYQGRHDKQEPLQHSKQCPFVSQ
jgi:hypothetical protein